MRLTATICAPSSAPRNGWSSSGPSKTANPPTIGCRPCRPTSPSTGSSTPSNCARVERDYQELKQEIGLGHYEGRGWRGFHHHATLCIAAYGFLIAGRETIPPSRHPQAGRFPTSAVSRRPGPTRSAPPARAPRSPLHRNPSTTDRRRARRRPPTLPLLPPPPGQCAYDAVRIGRRSPAPDPFAHRWP